MPFLWKELDQKTRKDGSRHSKLYVSVTIAMYYIAVGSELYS